MPVWTISAMTSDTNTTSAFAAAWGITFNPTGTRMYLAQRGAIVYQYDFSPALDLTTLSSAGSYTSAQVGTMNDVEFNNDGTKMYLLDQGGGATRGIYQYTLSTAYDVTSATYASKFLNVATQDSQPQHFQFKSDGTKVYVYGAGPTIRQYDLSSAWDISTGSYSGNSFTPDGTWTNAGGFFFKPDGTRLWATQTLGGVMKEFDLSTAWDITTASYNSNNFGFNPYDTSPRDIYITPDGTKLVMVGTAANQAWRFTLGALGSGAKVRGFVIYR